MPSAKALLRSFLRTSFRRELTLILSLKIIIILILKYTFFSEKPNKAELPHLLEQRMLSQASDSLPLFDPTKESIHD